MPKVSKSAQHKLCTIEEVLPEELSKQEETSSDQGVFLTPNHLQVKKHK